MQMLRFRQVADDGSTSPNLLHRLNPKPLWLEQVLLKSQGGALILHGLVSYPSVPSRSWTQTPTHDKLQLQQRRTKGRGIVMKNPWNMWIDRCRGLWVAREM